MRCVSLRWRLVLPPLIVAVAGVSEAVHAGPWSQLPEAVTLQRSGKAGPEVAATLAAAERSVLAEAAAGRLPAVRELMEAYAGLVAPLDDGEERWERLRARVAVALVRLAESRQDIDPQSGGAAFALAASYHPDEALLGRLRSLLLPPATAQPGQTWVAAADGAEMVWHPPLRFLMGCTQGDGDCLANERYLRWVEVPGLWVERTEVTNRAYRRCVEAGACSAPAEPLSFDDPARELEPVVGVTWHQAVTFATWAGRRLPSEAEWERAARGRRADWRFPWGSIRLKWVANVYGRPGVADRFAALAPVGSFPSSGWGLFDVGGNVWEWCADKFHDNLVQGPRDGSAWVEGGRGRVMRGGSWRRSVEQTRVSARDWQETSYAADDVGFRCVAGGGAKVDDQQLVLLALSVFPIRVEPGKELEGSALEATDRRYLERRAVTWLALEGRAWEALPHAVQLLARDQRDPVARDLLDRLEERLVAEATEGAAPLLEAWLAQYRSAMLASKLVADSRSALERRLARALQLAGKQLLDRGQTERAALAFRQALSLTPDDPKLMNLLRSTVPSPGATRVWARDHKAMVYIPAGSFLMGRGRGDQDGGTDEQPARTVWVKGFWVDRTEVTNAEYGRCVAAGACTVPHQHVEYDSPGAANHPVLWVDWYQARDYAVWAGKRLPSETEWEHAARAGQVGRYPWGDEWQEGMANAFGIRTGDPFVASAPVGSFPPNALGVSDMIGNAQEWVEDIYHTDYHGAPRDGRAWTQVTGGATLLTRVLRGGSFLSFPVSLRSSDREDRLPESAVRTTGFRCVAEDVTAVAPRGW